MKNYLKRFKNVGTVLALVGAVAQVAILCGVKFDAELVNAIAIAICNVFVVLGIMNNPTNEGLDLPTK